jgi:ATP-dependent DNA helicase RecG
MAPTEVLAQQHFKNIQKFLAPTGVISALLTGSTKISERREIHQGLEDGSIGIIVGTHALIEDNVIFKNLGLAIIDEQHRFGVAQREALRNKGQNVDVLALSATPIPRTLSMTIYGDMDISIINEKPAGRKPIKTTKISNSRICELVDRLKPQIDNGAKVFWVCPLVEETEGENWATAAEERHKVLTQYFSNTGLVHGQMDKKERDVTMAKFAEKNSDMQILVATTVIEVGIDVPQASIIVIENAEMFGLAALHQLRGRVGRGNTQSYCILLFGRNITEHGLRRLDTLCETEDGFVIAEQDLLMRGVGELLGTRQSGWLRYHFVDWREHNDLFKLASRAARDNEPDGWTRDLMYIFDNQGVLGA